MASKRRRRPNWFRGLLEDDELKKRLGSIILAIFIIWN